MSDFTLSPDYVFDEKIQYKTIVSQFENGAEQRRAKWASGQRSWTLQFNNRTAADFDTVIDFVTAKKGAYSSFTWTNPNDATEYTVRFEEDSVSFSNKAYGVYDFNFRLTEVK